MPLWELQQIKDMLYVRKFTEKSWSDCYCCLSSFCFIQNAWKSYSYRYETWHCYTDHSRAQPQKSRKSAKWTGRVTKINEYVSVNAEGTGNSSGRALKLGFFSVTNFCWVFSPKFWIQLSSDARVQKFQSVLSILCLKRVSAIFIKFLFF